MVDWCAYPNRDVFLAKRGVQLADEALAVARQLCAAGLSYVKVTVLAQKLTPNTRIDWSGVRDSFELAWQDWLGTAGFDREQDEDAWALRWARAYVEFAAGEKRAWLREPGGSTAPASAVTARRAPPPAGAPPAASAG